MAKSATDSFDLTKLVTDIELELGDLATPERRLCLAERIGRLDLQVRQFQVFERTLLAALRARDLVAREGAGRTLAPPARLIEITARDGLSAEGGLYPVDWDGMVAYRWTGPGDETVLRVWLDRSQAIVFEIAVHSYGDPRNENALQLSVDGAPLPLNVLGDRLLRSDPFPLADGALFTEVAITTPFMSGQATADPAPKPRARKGRAVKRDDGTEETAPVANPNSRGFSFTHLRFLSSV